MAVETELLPPRYRSPRRIGRGAMGDIYVATDELLGREVAVKVLAERYAADDGIRQRFKREALAAARLSGEPGAITIFDVGEWESRPFIVMEYLGGGSLDDRLRRDGAQPPGRVLAWLDQAAAALDAAHRHGIVHRDVKPANLLLNDRGELRVADFGIASAAGMDSMTLTGTVLGTAGYLSPEQAEGERAGPASDVYSLAVVAYELLSGQRPFERDSQTAEAAAHVNAPVPSIAQRCKNLPYEVDPVFQRALAKDPTARYPSAREFVGDLREAMRRSAGTTLAFAPPPPARPTAQRSGGRRVLLPLLLLLAAGIAGAIGAAVLTSGGSSQTVITRTVAGTGGTTTIRQTVTQSTTAAAPAAPPPPPSPQPPPPAPPAASGNGHTLNDQGYARIQSGNYAGAVPLLEQAVRQLQGSGPTDPYEGYANYNLGYALYRLGRCSEAIPYLKRAERLEPDRTEPRSIRQRAQHC
ncbi:MAG TPA: serine/threonine-protein kinase [Gaiellaceae bacterium]|nr:serine/threonine-protein kinase [Gaiellaceae bacterium]